MQPLSMGCTDFGVRIIYLNLSDFGFTRRYYLLLSEAYVEVGKSMHGQVAG